MSTPASGTVGAAPDEQIALNHVNQVARLVPGITHELNNCLQAIGGLTELLVERTDLPRDAVDKLRRIAEQSGRGSTVVRLLQDFARHREPSRQRVDVAAAIERISGLRQYALRRSRIGLRIGRATGGPLIVDGSVPALEQALLALILTAEDTVGPGAADREIAVVLHRSAATVTVVVDASGAADQTEQIEDRAATATPVPEIARGLVAARQLIEESGGTLTCERQSPARLVLALPASDVASS